MQDNRSKLRDTIAALKARTTGNGCTEAEAIAAAAKVAELLTKHGIADPADLDFDQWAAEIGRRSAVDDLWDAVAAFCYCKLWYEQTGKGWSVVYFGRWHDVMVAEYLHTLLVQTVASATRSFQKSPEYTRRRSPKTKREATKAFRQSMAETLSARLMGLLWRRGERPGGGHDSYAVILSPLQAVDAEIKRRGISFSTKTLDPVQGVKRGFDTAKSHGQAAARSVDIHAAVGSSRPSVVGLLT